MKVAFKLGYLGRGYHGFQHQPAVPTVQAAVRDALRSLGINDGSFCYAGRTDRGVSALGQVIDFYVNPAKADLAVPRVVNSRLPTDVWAWAWAPVPENFSARHAALWREYRYLLPGGGLDLDRMRKAARELVGVHNFRNLSSEKRGPSARNLMRLDLTEEKGIVVIDVRADGFLWNMVRKIATVLELVGSGERDLAWVGSLLDPETNRGVAPAPAEGLIMMDVGYQGVSWRVEPYSMRMAKERLSAVLKRDQALAEATGVLARSMEEFRG
ncbi:MAG TPA: tRNA pseudouridine(38-40) synthase TruA [Methanothrix sp.]|jgi:tRNA pseudouridine38-40 synthase|nr:tRNA pseudouridine(38-40) synthase TruA [Methanothrix sp.]OPX80662.1 MAG: tRNA pseudouridine synthase A [Methanosaeta sp. PtaB.Bin087]OPY56923.1 MAG: tRNA pseudouridine synthase A [Methanosaeta sp. PtaU1.Bin055]HNR59482.1 tRNA pseudouridine(38-40) synthase TruA [Methanothrix sp.]HNT71613.1 tRNA pseudouridine(38-40) synthase TruA [Methanothrix sp.]